ncbi:hypothetical protein CCM_07740 [Cordyceps militaris CM01]|uniref:Uncharacterized protein n=1 Tax=Cordyceps militaris (strain CM01) TaxID=983644 RepID=G3JQI4_CORMM|nr:uncharacterized protein CCM_07740 [Cordyceps militaris CM01]EGX89488.1 hypothetical protein CCM_07740 [Cordyceps militaris CM01]
MENRPAPHIVSEQSEEERLARFLKCASIADKHVDQEAELGDDNTLDITVESHISALTFRHIATATPMIVLEAELHHFWRTAILGASHWNPENRKHDTLIRLILQARARGTLTRPLSSVSGGQEPLSSSNRRHVLFSDGNSLWSGLPFLGTDLVQVWLDRFYQLDYANHHNQRVNLSCFVGRLLSVGIYNGPATCLLSLFRETLETDRALTSDKEVSVSHLIHALAAFIRYAKESTLSLSNGSEAPDVGTLPPSVASLGELARQSGTINVPGFSVERWKFWMSRLEELVNCGEESVATAAANCLGYVDCTSSTIYGPLENHTID